MTKPIEIKLCRGKACCPILTVSENNVRITDDEGGEVTITIEEAAILRDELNCLDNV